MEEYLNNEMEKSGRDCLRKQKPGGEGMNPREKGLRVKGHLVGYCGEVEDSPGGAGLF